MSGLATPAFDLESETSASQRNRFGSPPSSVGGSSEAGGSGVNIGRMGVITQTCTVAAAGAGMFVCVKCKRQLPQALAIPKSGAFGCKMDHASYNGLQTRWKKNKLRELWNSKSEEEQRAWFIKWQSMESKDKYAGLVYEEVTEQAKEDIEDKLDLFQPWWVYRDAGLAANRP